MGSMQRPVFAGRHLIGAANNALEAPLRIQDQAYSR
jgi:hypothetical protein